MRRGVLVKAERGASADTYGWLGVGKRDFGAGEAKAVLILEAPFPDGSGMETWLRVEIDRDEAEQLAGWLLESSRARAGR